MKINEIPRAELLKIIKAQARLLVCYRLGIEPEEETLDVLGKYHTEIVDIVKGE